MIDYSN